MASSTINPDTVTGAEVTGADGATLGKVDTLYLDNKTGEPEWAAVKSGLFGNHLSLVPLSQASFNGTALSVPFDKEQLKTAPHLDPDTELSPEAEQDLYKHYGLDYGQPSAPPKGQGKGEEKQDSRRDKSGEAGVQGRDTSGPTTDDAMTRSEEQLHVGTEQVQTGTARLRKHIVTENVSHTVPVSHEEVRVQREPITDANRDQAMGGSELSEEEHEVTLHAEQPVVTKETVPVERVKLGTETVTNEETVSDSVRKEQIEQTDEPRADRKR